ncbi:precorrin-6y C5,15-methyltransferase (decarboxylating) subunit CbiE [Desulfolutivibrio sulfoxidireducens]|uniref:precorrin-6y C5,15-methyltransferase (decarboxylating) subunit CbiE n=1 Tax=Desulfolutivibrio sulfoxidireducens TaxID=2773299 RepID=UPI001FE69937|nr:precorrin-6y C5,15-methyltransferase (decarboxylating) subunit CbiE [Desulfolutivibrio sulfoxidireducens]
MYRVRMGNATFSVLVAGVGIGRPSLPPDAAEAVAEARVLAAGKRLLDAFSDHPAEKIPLTGPLSAVLDRLAERHAAGFRVAVLADGDPLYFGIGRTLLTRFAPGDLRFIPNVTAVAAMAARLGRPFDDIPAVSLHGRDDHGPLFRALMRRGQAAVYTDAVHTPQALARAVLDRGGPDFALHVFENMGLADEKYTRLDLAAPLPDTAFSPLNMVFVERASPPETVLTLGLSASSLSRDDGVFTKAPVRAAALALLRIVPADTVWDLGAGTGSVALEAARLCPEGGVFAVEKDLGRFNHLVKNIRRTGALTVTPVHAAMPEALHTLPDPDRIFLGGGLSRAPHILPAVAARLAPHGRIVVAATLLDTLEQTRDFFTANHWSHQTTHIQAATETPLATHTRLIPDNPVFLVAGERDETRGEGFAPSPHPSPTRGTQSPWTPE